MIVAIDGTNWTHCLWHAMRGVGVADAMRRRIAAMRSHWPDAQICVAWDSSPTFRHEIYPEYKATRKPTANDLQATIAQVRTAIDAQPLRVDGYEADDILATVARLGAELGHRVVLCSPDKDLRQCLFDGWVTIMHKYTTVAGELCPVWLTARLLWEQTGLRPDQWIDYQSLVGDSTDNIPGCDGFGPKTAAELLQKHGTLDAAIANPWKCNLSSRQRDSLIKFGATRRSLMRKLVRLETLVPWVPEDLDLEPVGNRRGA